MKSILRKIIPSKLLLIYREKKIFKKLKKLSDKDVRRFYTNASLSVDNEISENKLNYRLIFITHSIEKGLSHRELRLGFGESKLTMIAELLKIYKDNNFNLEGQEYLDTISVLKEYYDVHRLNNYDLTFFEEIFHEFMSEINSFSYRRAGSETKTHQNKLDFKELSENRYSVRDYSTKEVSDDLITKAVDISMKTPSACNRQMWKIRSIKEKRVISEVLEYQGGFNGYEAPSVLFLITVSLESYQMVKERNQAFVDGGMFGMSFLYSLEYVGLAACPLHCDLEIDAEDKIRELLHIPKSEVLIMFIASGHFLEKYSVCNSPRIDREKILLHVHDS